jgi:hypothetical protein
MTPEQEAHFRLLKVLEQHPEYNQRQLAEAIGFPPYWSAGKNQRTLSL